MSEEPGKEKALDVVAIAAGSTAATVTGIGAFVASGMRQFSDATIEQARSKAAVYLKKVAAETLEEAKGLGKLPTKDFLIDLYKSEGRSLKHAERMADHELVKRVEQNAKDAARYVKDMMDMVTKDVQASLNHLEGEAAKWKAASILGKPMMGFKAVGTSVKLGVIGTAVALGLGVGWAVHSLRKNDTAKSFAERVRDQRATSMPQSR
jgi:hypothetical protein